MNNYNKKELTKMEKTNDTKNTKTTYKKPTEREIKENLVKLKQNVDVDLILKTLSLFDYKIEEFGKDCGISRSYFSSLLNGKYPSSEEHYKKINTAFTKLINKLLKDKNSANTILAVKVVELINSLRDSDYTEGLEETKKEYKSLLLQQIKMGTADDLNRMKTRLKKDLNDNIDKVFNEQLDVLEASKKN
jgi:hypothetical protein